MTDEELWALESLGHFHLVHGRHGLARPVFETLVTQWPERGYAYYGTGLIAVAEGDDDGAARYFAAAAARSDDPRFHLAHAEALLRLGKRAEARPILVSVATDETPIGARARALLSREAP